jgi:glutamate racemase
MEIVQHRPVGVFDAGIGSYAIVEMIQRRYPAQDIIYLADRANFPYGEMNRDELFRAVKSAADHLVDRGAAAVVLASNAPSVMVLDELRAHYRVPVIGVFPPISQALAKSRTGHVAVLGVRSLVNSAEIQAYVKREGARGRVEVEDASSLVALVESGQFLSRPEATQAAVSAFMRRLGDKHPDIDVCTLSSTHLPWLTEFLRRADSNIDFVDPATEVVAGLGHHTSIGSGNVMCIATESSDKPLSELKKMLKALHVTIEPEAIQIN